MNEYNYSFNIMTFDGGGVRGALSISLLERIKDYYPSLLEKTSLIGGTSTGSFIALGIAYGLTTEEIIDIYTPINSEYIFSKEHSGIKSSKYNNEKLKEILLKVFPEDLKLKDLSKFVIIPTFFLGDEENSWQPVFYSNIPNSNNADMKVIDVALASSAAPIYFPIYKNHIDGGIVANDPSLSCLIHAIDEGIKEKLENIRVLSIGTGHTYNNIKVDNPNWGAMDWIVGKEPPYPIISVTLDGNSQLSQLFTKKLLHDNYIRLNPKLEYNIKLDDYESIEYLKSLSQKCNIDDILKWIGEKWK